MRDDTSVADAPSGAGIAADPSREEELDSLTQQADQVAKVLEDIRQRISTLEGTARQ
jgi:hypothetical protein